MNKLMTEKIKTYQGAKLYCMLYGWGVVSEVKEDGRPRILFKNPADNSSFIRTYTADGRLGEHQCRTLFYSEPTITEAMLVPSYESPLLAGKIYTFSWLKEGLCQESETSHGIGKLLVDNAHTISFLGLGQVNCQTGKQTYTSPFTFTFAKNIGELTVKHEGKTLMVVGDC